MQDAVDECIAMTTLESGCGLDPISAEEDANGIIAEEGTVERSLTDDAQRAIDTMTATPVVRRPPHLREGRGGRHCRHHHAVHAGRRQRHLLAVVGGQLDLRAVGGHGGSGAPRLLELTAPPSGSGPAGVGVTDETAVCLDAHCAPVQECTGANS